MNIQKLKYKFHSGKNSKPWYYIKGYFRLYTPPRPSENYFRFCFSFQSETVVS